MAIQETAVGVRDGEESQMRYQNLDYEWRIYCELYLELLKNAKNDCDSSIPGAGARERKRWVNQNTFSFW